MGNLLLFPAQLFNAGAKLVSVPEAEPSKATVVRVELTGNIPKRYQICSQARTDPPTVEKKHRLQIITSSLCVDSVWTLTGFC